MNITAKSHCHIRNDRVKRTIYVRMSGFFDVESMQKACTAMRKATDEYRGDSHFFVADMRGLQPMMKDVAEIMGAGIGYSRAHGVIRCAHLSDSAITRLQTASIARSTSPGDDVTVDVVSEEEAEALIAEENARLKAAS